MNKKQIVIDYEEYLNLKEKAELNSQEIRDKVIESVTKYKKQLEDENRTRKVIITKYEKEELFDEIVKRMDKNLKPFKYVKYEDAINALADVLFGGIIE